MPGGHVPSQGLQRETLLGWCPLSFAIRLTPALALPRCFPGLTGKNRETAGLPGAVSRYRGWHRCFVTTVACPEAPAIAPRSSWGCPTCTAPAVPRMLLLLRGLSPALTSQGTPVAPVTHTGPCVPGQDLAIRLEWPCWKYRPVGSSHRPWGLASPALGSGGAMSKRGFFPGLSGSGVALGVGTGTKAP